MFHRWQRKQVAMARKTQSRMELRRQAEAAEAGGAAAEEADDELEVEADAEEEESGDDDGDDAPKKKKKPAKKKAAPRPKRTKAKAIIRKRLMWGVFSSSMKEEARFPFADRDAADQKMKTLAEKHKRTYFIQKIKEPIADAPIPAEKGAK